MKKCKCGQILNEETCSPSQIKRSGAKCKVCTREYSKQHYLRNKQKYISLSKNRADKYAEFNITRLLLFLSTQSCKDCGEVDPIVLEFDHLSDKLCNVSTLWRKIKSWDKIQEEIDKCDVVCANCHKKRTAKRSSFMKYRLINQGSTGSSLSGRI